MCTFAQFSQDLHCPDAVLLCVDDDPWGLDVTRMVLESNGYGVIGATGGHEALDIFRSNRVDLVLVHYAMPDMNGHEVAVKIKSLDPHVPVVLQSGAGKIPEAAREAADAFFLTGAGAHLLLTMIATLIVNYRNNRQRLGGNGSLGNSTP
jgi:CheY-like chemotaxis protein